MEFVSLSGAIARLGRKSEHNMIFEEIAKAIDSLVQVLVHNPLLVKYGLAGLFLNGMFSSVVPIPTELATSAMLLAGHTKLEVYIVLTIGSIAGGFIAYFLGKSGTKLFRFLHKTPKKQDEEKSHRLLAKYGWLAIFGCAWIPVLGDIIPIVAGTKNYDFRKFAISMSAGKAVKAVAIVYLASFFTPILFG